MGYKYQFITLAGIHSMWFNMFDLAHAYAQGEGMKHYVEKVQQPEFAAAKEATPSSLISRRWAPATSIRSPPLSRAAPPRSRR
jgi:isocitrate lyase